MTAVDTLSPVRAKEAARARTRALRALHDRVQQVARHIRGQMHEQARRSVALGALQEEVMADLGCSRGTADRVINDRQG